MGADGDADRRASTVLTVSNDGKFAAALAALLPPHGYAVLFADSPKSALSTVHRRLGGEAAMIALVDLDPGDEAHGLHLIARLQAEQPEMPCVLAAAELDAPTAVAALRLGVFDYFDKRTSPVALVAVLERCFSRLAQQREREGEYQSLLLAKEAAEAANRGKSGFLATISHELRTPLNAIIGFSEMMLRGVLGSIDNDQYRAYVADIHDSGTHLLRIINDILDLSKAEAGKLDLQEEVFDLRRTVRSVRQLMAERVRKAALSEAIELPADLPLLRADERKTKQVLLNLFANAVKFTPPGGRVTIVGHFDPVVGLRVTVSDTGIGIAPDDIGRVLEPFEQVDNSFSRSHHGTGLGLPLVKAIMELHGGSIELRSALGSGTDVVVTFPPQRAVVAAIGRKSLSAA